MEVGDLSDEVLDGTCISRKGLEEKLILSMALSMKNTVQYHPNIMHSHPQTAFRTCSVCVNVVPIFRDQGSLGGNDTSQVAWTHDIELDHRTSNCNEGGEQQVLGYIECASAEA